MEEDWIFDNLPAEFCGMVEEYRLELAKRFPIELDLDVSLAWCTICWIHENVLISKKFWFIKWLIDNDKIDFDKIQIWFQLTLWYWKYDSLLMLLSIQDSPVEFLCEILR